MLSSNAPFNEFGQSMILRDIEQLYLALNNAGTGSAGDGGTQDQMVGASQGTGDSGGLPDLSGLASIDYVNSAIADIPTPAQYSLCAIYGSGSVTASVGWVNAAYSTTSGDVSSLSGNVFTAPADGLYFCHSSLAAGFSGAPTANHAIITKITPNTSPVTASQGSAGPGTKDFTVGGVYPTWITYQESVNVHAIWYGRLSSGQTLTIEHNFPSATKYTTGSNLLNIAGIYSL
jgi:hypothetical protein